VDNYLNPAAFAFPDAGQLGNAGMFGVEGPGFWTIDVAFSRMVPLGAMRNLELRSRPSTFSTTSTGATRC
jgi:hypothetical protein